MSIKQFMQNFRMRKCRSKKSKMDPELDFPSEGDFQKSHLYQLVIEWCPFFFQTRVDRAM